MLERADGLPDRQVERKPGALSVRKLDLERAVSRLDRPVAERAQIRRQLVDERRLVEPYEAPHELSVVGPLPGRAGLAARCAPPLVRAYAASRRQAASISESSLTAAVRPWT